MPIRSLWRSRVRRDRLSFSPLTARIRENGRPGMCRGCSRVGCQIQPRERASWTASWRLAAPSLAAAEER